MTNTKETTEKKSKTKNKILKTISKIVLGLILVFVVVILFVRSPWGQDIIVNKAVSYISDKTNTKVAVKNLFITFSGAIQLDGLYLEDTKGDTLVYSKSLEANVPLWSIITGKGVGVDALTWEGLRANIIRKDSISGYNFQFLVDAFTTPDPTAVKTDTTAAPLHLVLGKLNFKDFDIVFDDAVAGIDSHFKIGNLAADMEKTDLENMVFKASKLELSDSNMTFIQNPVPEIPDTEPSILPVLAVDNLNVTQVSANYQSYTDKMIAEVTIEDLSSKIPNIDLANNIVEVETFQLHNSSLVLRTETKTKAINYTSKKASEALVKETPAFNWPAVQVAVGHLDLQNNNFSYFVDNTPTRQGVFNPNAIAVTNFNLLANTINLKNQNAEMQVENIGFHEVSGIHLKNLSFNFKATHQALNISNLETVLNNNALSANLSIDYPSISALIKNPETSKFNLDIASFQVGLQDVFLIEPELKNIVQLETLSKKQLKGRLKANGNLSNIKVTEMNTHWGSDTQISLFGTLENATQLDSLQFDVPEFSAVTKNSDILQFVNEKDLGVHLPEDAVLKGSLSGTPKAIFTQATLSTTHGVAKVDAHFKNDKKLAFRADINIEDYKLNALLDNPQMGPLSLNLQASGEGENINELDARLDLDLLSFKYNDYDISNLKILGDIEDGRGTITSKYKDTNLNTNFYAFVVLDSLASQASIKLDIKGADLQALGLSQRPIKTAMIVYADFKGHTNNFDLAALVDEGVVVYDKKNYLIGDINAVAHVDADTTSFSFNNKLINIDLQSNADPSRFTKSLQRHVARYFSRDIKVTDTINKPVRLKLTGNINQSPILKEVFFDNIKTLDTINLAVDFNESHRQLKANITAPRINYSGAELDSLSFSMNTHAEKFNFNLGFKALKAEPLHIQKTEIKGEQIDKTLVLSFLAYHNEEKLIQILSEITGDQEQLRFHVKPTNLILDKQLWNTPDNNEILITNNKLEFNDFRFFKDQQSVEITDKLASQTRDHIAINYKNFKISEFLSYLNPDEKLATGNLNGDFIIEDPFTNPGIVANLQISQFKFMDVNLDTLEVDAKSLGENSYDFHANLRGGDIDLDVKGDYIALNTGPELDLNLDINQFNMSVLKAFSQNQITESSGWFSGQFNLSGPLSKPQYQGQLNFKNAGFKLAVFNAAFTLKNESITVNNSGFFLDNFTILDENNNPFEATGSIGTKSFTNPSFDIVAKASNFQFLNATKTDNNFLYGQASFDAEAKITGNLQIPKVKMKLAVGANTNITYVLPSATANIEERDGVVVFVNREHPDAILTRTEERRATIRGLDIEALLNIDKDAAVSLIINEDTGDNFKVSGEGDLNLSIKPNGSMTLAGIYEVQDGHYEMNLYNVVDRKFKLSPGSRVIWSGNPFDADLDIKALYEIKTSASALMAPVLSGDDVASRGKFRQVLPFYVFLNIDGQLMAPKINFGLDMPKDSQGAIGGQVYGRVQQLNQQQDELNRQVFSLLVLNRFYPNPGSDGSAGGATSIAKHNLNDAISDQLNIFSEKVLGKTGFDLDFGLDSYTDYQGLNPEERTQLDIAAQKKLFNDRLIVRVGSEVDIQGGSSTNKETPLIGNVSIEYLITENGRYRLRGFRRDEFENVIDGQTIVSGIALIFTKEFNKFNELWKALLASEQEAEAEKQKAKGNKK
ncbi:translocation/assembly module TamB domain-containing protein [Oceanihabitans sp. IOP_32]|uniref:translocation/assembly module TamB domain-containing protein n=1 Tax=Oceanihabitans sp. IOP_32 TaxID=2529032 RepID=UPI001D172784|nr:translocation/assembly module TamB domain-containing protein [Oceanihabitans sp. IOP_32]